LGSPELLVQKVRQLSDRRIGVIDRIPSVSGRDAGRHPQEARGSHQDSSSKGHGLIGRVLAAARLEKGKKGRVLAAMRILLANSKPCRSNTYYQADIGSIARTKTERLVFS
jgi:hypothetical protein